MRSADCVSGRGGPAERLCAEGLAIVDGFLSPASVDALRRSASLRRDRGEFAPAGVGRAARATRRADLRGDSTCWLTEPCCAAERSLLDAVERLRLDINRLGYLGLFDLEMHYAWYPPGAGYIRHLDQPRGSDARAVSVILYLNTDWCTAAGGELRIYDSTGGPCDIEPIAGRLVCFWSAEREHEVLPTRTDRLSVSGWFRRRSDTPENATQR